MPSLPKTKLSNGMDPYCGLYQIRWMCTILINICIRNITKTIIIICWVQAYSGVNWGYPIFSNPQNSTPITGRHCPICRWTMQYVIVRDKWFSMPKPLTATDRIQSGMQIKVSQIISIYMLIWSCTRHSSIATVRILLRHHAQRSTKCLLVHCDTYTCNISYYNGRAVPAFKKPVCARTRVYGKLLFAGNKPITNYAKVYVCKRPSFQFA